MADQHEITDTSQDTASEIEDFEETADQSRGRRERWGEHEPGGATSAGGSPQDALS